MPDEPSGTVDEIMSLVRQQRAINFVDRMLLVHEIERLRKEVEGLRDHRDTCQADAERIFGLLEAERDGKKGFSGEIERLRAENAKLREIVVACVKANDEGDYYNDVHVWGPAREAAQAAKEPDDA